MRAILVGCGAMSPAWLRSAKEVEGLEIAGLVDLREDAARARQLEFGLDKAAIGSNLEHLLEQIKPDVLFDCTVPEAHYSNALMAFKHGVHVLGEKPLADTLPRARAMVEAARKANLIHAVIQNRRFDPNIRRVRRFLENGGIGEITTVNADFYIAAHFGGFRDAMQHPLLLDMAIHTFDAARLISGQDPVSVYCQEWNPKGSWYAHGASAMAIFEMTGGVIFNYRGSWCSEGAHTAWESDWRIIGTQGTLRWDGGAHPKASVVSAAVHKVGDGWSSMFASQDTSELPGLDPQDRVGAHAGLIREMVQCIRWGQTPETASSDNIKSLAMVFAAIESAQTGAKVAVSWD
ncbi:MAG: Gfo/Idh/MocA family oxidoreductase [Thermaceae bacterium]|nr:Gfo/Idh/MocA family oxidoreductase [Thermaceae bacterium]